MNVMGDNSNVFASHALDYLMFIEGYKLITQHDGIQDYSKR